MAFSFLKRGNIEEQIRQIQLSSYVPELTLQKLTAGVDNVRHDVYLSSKFCDQIRVHLSRLITKYGNVEDLAVETSNSLVPAFPAFSKVPPANRQSSGVPDSGEFKRLLAEIQTGSLQRAKDSGNLSIDFIARLAIIKYLRTELANQFNQVLERCRARLKQYENPNHMNPGLGIALRDRFLNLQFRKKSVLRLAGQDLYMTMLSVEKETLSRMRRSLFGQPDSEGHELFTNRLMFSDDGRDDHINAEHYVMLGNFDRDPDRFQTMLAIASEFLVAINITMDGTTEQVVEGWLNEPENAERLMAGGNPDESAREADVQKALLAEWVQTLEQNGVLEYVLASYEVVPLLSDYSPLINPQQLKNSLISKPERDRVEKLLAEHGKISAEKLNNARRHLHSYRNAERTKIAGRFMRDFMRYHRDLRRLQTVDSAMDMVNVITNEKLRELSTINNTLYEFLLPEEQKPPEQKISYHVIIKADLRDSTELTQTLVQRGLNPASYFGLNFFDPVNKLLAHYGATKVFIEGDAIILCLFGREHEPGNAVARACALAQEMLDIVRGYNQKLQAEGLPTLELGIGISYQSGAPLYLVDGEARIMISQALNESDRLSSCSRGIRKSIPSPGLFNVFAFEALQYFEGNQLGYNVGGIKLGEPAFEQLRNEISLASRRSEVSLLGTQQSVEFYVGLVPLGSSNFRKIVIRVGSVTQIDPATLQLQGATSRRYYEVCSNPAIFRLFEAAAVANASVQ